MEDQKKLNMGAIVAGPLFMLSAAILFTAYNMMIKLINPEYNAWHIYLYYCIIGVIVTFPMFAMNPVIPSTTVEWIMILGMVLISIIAQLLMNQGFLYCRGWEGGVFLSSEVIFTAIMGIVFLGDPVSWRFWTSGFMIVRSVFALSRLNADKQKRKSLIN